MVKYLCTIAHSVSDLSATLDSVTTPLASSAMSCHTISMKQIKFNQSGIYASDSRLASIAEECIRAERIAREQRAAARAAGAQESTWSVNW